MIFLAVFLHKIPEGFTVASVLLASGRSRGIAWGSSVLLGVSTLAGVPAMPALQLFLGIGLSLSTGVTTYLAASDLIPEVNKEPGVKMALPVFLDVGLMCGLDQLFPPALAGYSTSCFAL